MLPSGGKRLGGEPAPYVYHAHALGAKALVVSRVGRDASHEIIEQIQGMS